MKLILIALPLLAGCARLRCYDAADVRYQSTVDAECIEKGIPFEECEAEKKAFSQMEKDQEMCK